MSARKNSQPHQIFVRSCQPVQSCPVAAVHGGDGVEGDAGGVGGVSEESVLLIELLQTDCW